MFKFSIGATESLHPQREPDIIKVTAKDIDKDDAMFKRICDLYFQLLEAEYVYKKSIGMITPNPANDKAGIFTGIMSMLETYNGIYLLKVDDAILAMASVKDGHYKDYGRISNVVVDKDYRGHGYGRMILEYVMRDCGKKHFELNCDAANENGQKLYKSLGFKVASCVMVKI